MVGSFKKVFYLIVETRKLNDEVLATVFCLVGQTMNDRPLTSISSEKSISTFGRSSKEHKPTPTPFGLDG